MDKRNLSGNGNSFQVGHAFQKLICHRSRQLFQADTTLQLEDAEDSRQWECQKPNQPASHLRVPVPRALTSRKPRTQHVKGFKRFIVSMASPRKTAVSEGGPAPTLHSSVVVTLLQLLGVCYCYLYWMSVRLLLSMTAFVGL